MKALHQDGISVSGAQVSSCAKTFVGSIRSEMANSPAAKAQSGSQSALIPRRQRFSRVTVMQKDTLYKTLYSAG